MQDDRKIILTVGVSGSGKTTWARHMCERNLDWVHISRDDLRATVFALNKPQDYKFNRENEDLIVKTQAEVVKTLFDNGKQVIIIGDTNLKSNVLAFWHKFAKELGVGCVEQVFDVPLKELKKRNLSRGDKAVPEKVIIGQYRLFREYLGKPFYFPYETLPKAVIFDIDGTLVDNNHRSPYDMSKIMDDKIKPMTVELLRMFQAKGYAIITCSGRPMGVDNKVYKETLRYLGEHDIIPEKHFQRAQHDFRSDDVVKEEIFFKHIAPFYNVKLAVDDRDQVVDMYRSIGVECWQVNYGDF